MLFCTNYTSGKMQIYQNKSFNKNSSILISTPNLSINRSINVFILTEKQHRSYCDVINWVRCAIFYGVRRVLHAFQIASSGLSMSSMFSSTSITTQYTGKRGAELAVKDGVDERVQSRVAVTEPEDDGEQRCWNVEFQQEGQRVEKEER